MLHDQFSAKLDHHLRENVNFLKEMHSQMQLQSSPHRPPSSLAQKNSISRAASTAASALGSLKEQTTCKQRPPTRQRPEAVTVVNKLLTTKKSTILQQQQKKAATMMNANKGGGGDEKKKKIPPHHDDDELLLESKSSKFDDASSFYSLAPSSIAESTTPSTVISYKGKPMEMTDCSPQQLILFLVDDLKSKVKSSRGSEYTTDLSKHFKQLNYAIKRAFVEQATKNLASDEAQLASSTCTRLNEHDVRSEDKQRTTSKDVQTDLAAGEVTKWEQFHDKYLEHQLTLNEKLKKFEEIFASESGKKSDEIVRLTTELSRLQAKINDIVSCSERSMAQRFDTQIEEVKSEMKFLTGRIEGTNNRHLIDSMHVKLEQTSKKLDEVKSKCTKAVKSCLRMQMESLCNNATSSPQVERELGLIKSNFDRELSELQRAVSADVLKHFRLHHEDVSSCNTSMTSLPSSSSSSGCSTAASVRRKSSRVAASSINSLARWNGVDDSANVRFDRGCCGMGIIDGAKFESQEANDDVKLE